MESRSHDLALAYQDGITALRRQYLYTFSCAHDFRSADENQFQRGLTQLGFRFTDGTVNLTAVSVAPYANVQNAERALRRILNILRQKNRSGTGAESRFRAYELSQLLQKSVLFQEIQERTGFAAGDHDGVDSVQLLGFADERDFRAQLLEPGFVRFVVTLDGQDADVHAFSPHPERKRGIPIILDELKGMYGPVELRGDKGSLASLEISEKAQKAKLPAPSLQQVRL